MSDIIRFSDVKLKMKEMLVPSLLVSFAYLAQSLIVATDVLIISWLGVEELAASGFVVRLYMPFFLLALGFSIPILSLCGQAKGQEDYKKLRGIFQHSLALNFSVSLLSVFLTKYLLNEYLFFIGQPENIIKYANDYADFFLWSIPLAVWGSSIRSFMTVAGNAKYFMYLGFVAFVLNAVFDYIFVFGLDGFIEPMGISGAAVATIVVNVIYLLSLVYLLINNESFKEYKVLTELEKVKLKLIKKISFVGFPMSIRMIIESGLMVYYYTLMAGFGTFYLAGFQVSYQVDTMAFLFAIGTATAILTNVGIAKGRRNVNEILLSTYAGTFLMTLFLSGIGLFFLVLTPIVADLFFSNSDDYEIIKPILINMLIIVSSYQFFHSLYFSILSAIDGMGKTKTSSILFIITLLIVGVGGAYVLKQTPLGGYGILISLFLSYIASFFVLLPLFIKYIKEYRIKYDG